MNTFQQAAQAAAIDCYEVCFGVRVTESEACKQTIQILSERFARHFAPLEAQLAEAKEGNAVLKSQVENADANLEQCKLNQKAIWRTKVESAESRIAELEKKCDEARREVARLEKLLEPLKVDDIADQFKRLWTIARKSPAYWQEAVEIVESLLSEAQTQRDQLSTDNQRLREALSHWEFYANHNRSQTQFEICVKHLEALSTPPPSAVQDLELQARKAKAWDNTICIMRDSASYERLGRFVEIEHEAIEAAMKKGES